ncbi:heavy metal translocating P-type ATPase [Streptomyces sp. WAC 06725]|uniref:heavy metal translocating P-type ATPase n=1 Tax=Streptomyces sp. WAC 06725 TaxID=2203209 RepID=UPI000F74A971|nr:heavy metal translocating P-type ATPase [Streptomyces sp. WAC 06725]RSO19143.1 heavy metal translocating P-type ATPase [Streptomyces sp. WAC 06725]
MSEHVTVLTVGGMTCAACVNRVEKKLGRLDGVTATVNLATGKARVQHPATLAVSDLVATVEAAGFTAQLPEPVREPAGAPVREPVGETTAPEDRPADADRTRLLVTALLSVPVLVLSMVPAWQFRNWQWLCFALTAPVAVWGALPFHLRAARGLRHGAATMDTLVSLGVAASFAWSAYALFLSGGTAHSYLEAAVGVPLFVLAGRRLEAGARRGTGSALRALAELVGKDVSVRVPAEDGAAGTAATVERRIPVADLQVGDRFLVRPGERVATDGTVVDGSSALDLSLVTGESRPVEVGPGSAVVGGAVNAGGLLEVRAAAVGADTRLARITRLVEEAQTGKTRVQRLADTVAGVFVPAVLAVSVTVLGFWLGAGADPQAAVTAAVAVLVVACPCALGLATPTALLAATGRGAQLGILVSGPQALERLRRIDTLVLDKTGTLTTGRMSVVGVTGRTDAGAVAGRTDTGSVVDAADEAVRLNTAEAEAVRLDTAQAEATGRAAEETVSLTPDEAVRLAAAVEHGSEHPLARAITAYGDTRRTALGDHRPLPAVRRFAATAGYGVTGEVDGRTVTVGRPGDLTELPAALADAVRTAEDAGHTAVLVTADGTPQAVVAVGDTLRPDCYRAVDHLRRLGLRPVLATGDRAATARAVAGHLGITEIHAGALPEEKAALVTTLKEQGGRVAVVGDGINDAAALAHADLGIAMGSGTDAAIGAADVTVLRDDLQAVPDAVRLARRTLGTIRANLVWAFGYNLVTVPLAAVGRLDPMIAAAAMSASSLLVVGNSLRLRAWRPGGRGTDRRTADGRKTAGRGAAGRRAFSFETSRESV